MKAVLVATAMTCVLIVGVSVAFRLHPTSRRVRPLMLVYVGTLPLSMALWLFTPSDLGMLPTFLMTTPNWLDFLLMMFFFSAAHFGGVLQLYNLADRGLSLRMLIDIDEA